MSSLIFISHSSRDSDFVNRLRQALDVKGYYHIAASRELRGGDEPIDAIYKRIETAQAFIVVVSPDAFNSAWVAEETRHAAQIKERRKGDYPLIPLLREGVELGALKWLFIDNPLAIRVVKGSTGIRKAMPLILRALGNQNASPGPVQGQAMSGSGEPSKYSAFAPQGAPFDELLLEMRSPSIEERDGRKIASATAELTYISGNPKKTPTESREPFLFTAPLGADEFIELKWYLEQYYLWPTGEAKTRAKSVEALLPQWGRDLRASAMPDECCANVLKAWRRDYTGLERRLTVFIDSQLVKGSSRIRQKEANEAAMLLMALPWELLHDDKGYLFQGAKSIRARRQFPFRRPRDIYAATPPLRILLVSPTADKGPLPPAIPPPHQGKPTGDSGEIAEISSLSPNNLTELEKELKRAGDANAPYHVIHLDGHGVYKGGMCPAGVCFEDEPNATAPPGWPADWETHADRLADIGRNHRVHLFFSRSLSLRRG